ncbi:MULTISPECIES: sigma-70 family RNA polymerase sigma factor [Clostridium]|uniref:Sigma-70 family RNA polymerase sigma factor n=1 Tax=Clostridium cibarium TaxID=2762247 RepID=A0ABR8PUQ1_9CLOT|nr:MULTISPECIES: sigma-70 family RNA polymerase sigma factor [Clostridium]MBD7911899.1 sigma-70 family RNA polymerase sigma factor [Clostridium cibarium]
MNYDYIESLVSLCKSGDIKSKENLISEFTPFIINFSSKAFIDGYDFEDIQNECYITLLHAIEMYNPVSHRFVAYATNAIKNSIYAIVKKSNITKQVQGINTLTFDGDLSSLNANFFSSFEDNLNYKYSSSNFFQLIDTLTPPEKELLVFNMLKQNSLKSYANWKNMPCSTVNNRKISLQKKLKKVLN